MLEVKSIHKGQNIIIQFEENIIGMKLVSYILKGTLTPKTRITPQIESSLLILMVFFFQLFLDN